MLEQTSKEFRESFLLKLTKEIIRNTQTYKNLEIKKEVTEFAKEENRPALLDLQKPIETVREIKKEEVKDFIKKEIKKEEVKDFIKKEIKKESEKMSEMKNEDLASGLKMIYGYNQGPIQRPPKNIFAKKIPPAIRIPQTIRIPEPALPETVSYLKPIPTSEQIDLGKLNALRRDPLVKVIECSTFEENVFVVGIMGRKKTPIKLNKEEKEDILKKFSQTAKIPLTEGLFKAAVGNLVISAVISEIAGIQFVIRKISQGQF